MTNDLMRLREAGSVERCHTVPHARSYSVGFHTFQMLVLLRHFYPAAPRILWEAVLLHDLHERWLGDMPGQTKLVHPELHAADKDASRVVRNTTGIDEAEKRLSSIESVWLKTIDRIELWLWCHDELAAGNKHVKNVEENVNIWFQENWPVIPEKCRRFVESFSWCRTRESIARDAL